MSLSQDIVALMQAKGKTNAKLSDSVETQIEKRNALVNERKQDGTIPPQITPWCDLDRERTKHL